MALKLNQEKIVQNTLYLTPEEQIPLLSQNLAVNYLQPILHFLAKFLKFEYKKGLLWIQQIYKFHPLYLLSQTSSVQLKQVQESLLFLDKNLKEVVNQNIYTLKFVTQMGPEDLNETEDC